MTASSCDANHVECFLFFRRLKHLPLLATSIIQTRYLDFLGVKPNKMSGSDVQKLIAFASRVELKTKAGEE